jgi:hypothetical protein
VDTVYLIITLLSGNVGYWGTIETITFTSLENCNIAKETYLSAVKNDSKYTGLGFVRAVCVDQ